jgi:UDP-N-acetyl-D-galactosamine dehydrogenase
MPFWVAHQIIKMLIKAGTKVEWAKILILWLTFKENVPDFRNSKIADTIKELKEFWVNITGYDPYHTYLHDHDREELNIEKAELINEINGTYDGIIFAQNHKEFDDVNIAKLLEKNGIIFDVKGTLRKKWFNNYKSL